MWFTPFLSGASPPKKKSWIRSCLRFIANYAAKISINLFWGKNNTHKNKTQQNVDLPVTLASNISVAMFRSLRASEALPAQKE